MSTGLLWICFVSIKTPDVLNANLGLFYSFQYLMSLAHAVVSFTLRAQQARFLRFVFVLAQTGGPAGLTFVCIQRFVAVVHPASYPLLKKYKYCEISAAAVWILSVPTAVGGVFVQFPSSKAKAMSDAPLILMVAMIGMMWQCSIKMVLMLRRRGPGKGKVHPAKKRAFRTIAATTAITITFYIPVALLQRLKSDDECNFECVLMPRCVFLLSVASLVHPLFYLYTQRKLLTCCLKENR